MTEDIKFYTRLFLRRFPAMAALFLFSTCIGVVIALRLPTEYTTSATLLVEASQIPAEMVRATAQINTDEQLEVIQQRLMTRANLLAVARDNRVFAGEPDMHPDEIFRSMRDRTRIRRSSGRSSADILTIQFQGSRPEQITKVVNQYVTIVLEASNELRSGRAEGTLEFFQQEVEDLSQQLDEQSKKIVAFKAENSDALPEGLNFRLQRQALMQERLARAERDLEALEKQKEEIQRIYERTGTVAPSNPARTPDQRRLIGLQEDLNAALGIYSENHPQIKLLRNKIEVAQKQIQAASLIEPPVSESDEIQQVTALDVSLAEIDARISSLTQEITDTSAEIERLGDSVERTPTNANALDAMERDQRNVQQLYASAVQRLSQAQMGERLEVSAKGERIIVLEPATVPNAPSGPNRPKIMLMGVAGGIGLAAGLFLLLELLNTTVRRSSDINRGLDIAPLATIPCFETRADHRHRRMMQLTTLVAVLIVVPSGLWAVDTFFMPLEQLLDKVIDRLT